jgi:hypothetical protein
MSVLHAKTQQANAGGSIRKRRFGMDDGKNGKKESEAERRQTQCSILPGLTGLAAPPDAGGAHLSAFHRGSRQGDA